MERVLVVDDEIQVANALRRLLRRAGFEVRTASSGPEALAALEVFAPDLVLSDFRMPGMSGAELLAEVRRRYPLALRVVLSGFADLGSVVASVNDGEICRFIHKPWDDAELVERIRRLLAERQAMAELYQCVGPEDGPLSAEVYPIDGAFRLRLSSAPGAPCTPAQAAALLARMVGVLSEERVRLIAGLLDRSGGRVSLVAEVGGTEVVTVDLPTGEADQENACASPR